MRWFSGPGRLALGADILSMNLGRRRIFRTILMVTARCPLDCAVCGIARRDDDAQPTLSELERFFARNRITWLNLTGGEPFARRDMDRILTLAARRPTPLTSFPTSGFFPERTLAATEAGLSAGLPRSVVTVSFDGDETAHDRLRGRPGAFDRALRTFRGLKGLAAKSGGRLEVHPGMTLSAPLIAMLPDPLEALRKALDLAGIHEIHLNLAHDAPHYYGNDGLEPLPKKPAHALLERLSRARSGRSSPLNRLERIYLEGARRYLETGRPPVPCRSLRNSVFVDARWNVYPCTIHDRLVGNLRDHEFSLKRLARTAAFRKARKDVTEGKCPGCWTPCEANTALLGGWLHPAVRRLAREETTYPDA